MSEFVMNVEIITILTFTKLFVISIVAMSFLGFSNKPSKVLDLFDLSCFKSLICDGLKENKATSEPEINAEINNSIKTAIKPIISLTPIEFRTMPSKIFNALS